MPNCPDCNRPHQPSFGDRCRWCDAVIPKPEPDAPQPRFKRDEGTRQRHILLPAELDAELRALAEAEHWTVSAAIRECIKAELARRKEG